jgi:hypothetical protein
MADLPLRRSVRLSTGIGRGRVVKVASGTAGVTYPVFNECMANTSFPVGITETSAAASQNVTVVILGPVYAESEEALSVGTTVVCSSAGRVAKATA